MTTLAGVGTLAAASGVSSRAARRGWHSKYDFSALPAWKRTHKNSSLDVATNARSKRNYLALIAAMAIDKYGYDPAAAKSGVASHLAILLRTKGFTLTDEVIRGYLKEGSGHLLPGPRR